MRKEKTVKAEIRKIVSSTEKNELRRNYQKEDNIRDYVESKNHELNFKTHEYEYEEELIKDISWKDTIQKDPLTEESCIISRQKWIEYKLLVAYKYRGKEYESEITCEKGRNPYQPNQLVYVTIDENNPTNIISISDKNEHLLLTFGQPFVIFSVIILLIILIALIYVYY